MLERENDVCRYSFTSYLPDKRRPSHARQTETRSIHLEFHWAFRKAGKVTPHERPPTAGLSFGGLPSLQNYRLTHHLGKNLPLTKFRQLYQQQGHSCTAYFSQSVAMFCYCFFQVPRICFTGSHTAPEAEVSLILVSNQNLSRRWNFRGNATRKW